MAKQKFYAVRIGRQTGVFTNWDECKAQVDGYPNAKFQSFKTEDEAWAFVHQGAQAKPAVKPPQAHSDPAPAGDYAFVDGSWNDATKTYGYGGFVVINGVEHIIQGSGNDENMAGMRNVAGEIAGAMAAAKFAMQHGCKNLTILHDYLGIARWVDGSWRTGNEHTRAYKDYMTAIDVIMPLSFQHVKGHTGIAGNEKADQLAKEAVDII